MDHGLMNEEIINQFTEVRPTETEYLIQGPHFLDEG